MPAPISISAAFRLPPRDAIAYFEAKGYRISWDWWDTWQEAHAKAFTLTKAAQLDILEDVQSVFEDGLKAGLSEREIVKDLEPRLKSKGWWGRLPLLGEDGEPLFDANGKPLTYLAGSPWRIKNAWRTNKRVALQTGRYKQQQGRAEAFPYWQYVAVMDSRVRRSHAALHGRVFRHDDPIWDRLYPPNGWGCRCRVRAMSQDALERRGLAVSDSAGQLEDILQDVGIDKRTGEQIRRPGVRWRDPLDPDNSLTPDAGWSYNPARAGTEEIRKRIVEKAPNLLGPEQAAALLAQLLDPPDSPERPDS